MKGAIAAQKAAANLSEYGDDSFKKMGVDGRRKHNNNKSFNRGLNSKFFYVNLCYLFFGKLLEKKIYKNDFLGIFKHNFRLLFFWYFGCP